MSIRKKAIGYLSILLAFCTTAAGCSSSSGSSQGNSTDSSYSSAYSAEASSSNEASDPSLSDTTNAAEVATAPAATTAPSAATTIPPAPATAPLKPFNEMLDTLIGQSVAYVTQQFGSPIAVEKSEYGFSWYVYHNNYTRLVMIGIKNNIVVGLYSNSAELKFNNISVGTPKSSVRSSMKGYTGPLASIIKNNTATSYTEYKFDRTIMEQRDVFTDGQKYVTLFYENIKIKDGVLTAVQIIEYSTEQNTGGLPNPDTELAKSYERISFYLINSIRVRFGKPVLQYDNNMAKVAAAHSQDMITRRYFDHLNPQGQKVDGRIEAAGYSYRSCGENIAKDHPNAISAHENYLNSPRHRDNILGDFKHLGVGVRMDGKSILQTQVFVTFP